MKGWPAAKAMPGPNSPIIDPSESVRLCKGLERRGASFFIESLGNAACSAQLMCPDKNGPETVYQHITAAKLLRKNLRPETTVICGGLSILRNGRNNGMQGAEPEKNSLFYWGNTCIDQGDFDMIALGRQSFADPALPSKYLGGQQDGIRWCTCCNKCGALLGAQQPTGCVVYNPAYTARYQALK